MRAPHRRGDDGLTLIELTVTMALMAVISAVVLTAMTTTRKTLGVTDDESRGLADVKTVAERLDRDVRNARGVVCDGANLADGTPDPGCNSHLQLWIDFNANYKRDSGETVTWSLQPLGDTHHFKVIRSLDSGESKIEATSLVVNFAFTYDVVPTDAYTTTPTTVVNTGMTYDALYGTGAASRTLKFSTRLRNVS